MPAHDADRSRPPSVNDLALSLADTRLPHPVLVDIARQAIAAGDVADARVRAERAQRDLLGPVINATGVLLHTNLGRAPLAFASDGSATNLEFDVASGVRGGRGRGVNRLAATLCGAQDALVVNNCAGAVLLALAALAAGRQVLVSRGESVEIGGGFRIPDVAAQSGAILIDVGTTNRTRAEDYRREISVDVGCVLRVHRSNFRIDGFTTTPSVAELAGLGVPLLVDLGSGLVDSRCPWLPGGPPRWLQGEPGARQLIEAGADLVMFSGDKLLGGPQAGIIAGDAELVARCRAHPLARALRAGSLTMRALQDVLLAYLRRDVSGLTFWAMATAPDDDIRRRADLVVAAVGPPATVVPTDATPGAGCTPGTTISSFGVGLPGDRCAVLRRHSPPVIARVYDDVTYCDLRSVAPSDDSALVDALRGAVDDASATAS